MQVSEFVEATARLEEYYNKEYTKEQRQIMFEELGDFELERYRILVSQAIRKCKYLPRVSEIFQIDSELQYKNTKEKPEKIECKKCKSTGYRLYEKKIDNGKGGYFYNTYAALCDCGNAKQYKGWEITDKEHRSNYYIPTMQEIGLY